jgi:hypothetical protein
MERINLNLDFHKKSEFWAAWEHTFAPKNLEMWDGTNKINDLGD